MQREIVRSSSFDSACIAERSFSRWKRFDRAFERAKSAKWRVAVKIARLKRGMGAKRCVLLALCDVRKQSPTLETVPISSNVALYREKSREGAVQLIPDRQNDVSLLLPRESLRLNWKQTCFFRGKRRKCDGYSTGMRPTQREDEETRSSRQPFAFTRDFIPRITETRVSNPYVRMAQSFLGRDFVRICNFLHLTRLLAYLSSGLN